MILVYRLRSFDGGLMSYDDGEFGLESDGEEEDEEKCVENEVANQNRTF